MARSPSPLLSCALPRHAELGCWALSLSFPASARGIQKFVTAGARRQEEFLDEGFVGFVRNGRAAGRTDRSALFKIFALTRLLRLSIQSDLCVKELSRATTCSCHMVHFEVSLTLPNTTNPVARHNRRPPRGCHDPTNFSGGPRSTPAH